MYIQSEKRVYFHSNTKYVVVVVDAGIVVSDCVNTTRVQLFV